jgi:predicted NUDIX family NTP pyrophosphohydrolase
VKKISGGLILYNRQICNQIKFLIAHPGGPFFENRDLGWWTITKGEPEENEDVFDVAIRKFEEETGMKPNGPYMDLGNILQKNGKRVYAWAFEEDWEQERVPMCNEITLEYPKGSGRLWTFPEIDQAMMMNAEEAKKKLRSEQTPLIDRLLNHIQDKT